MKNKFFSKKKSGFTLIEMLVFIFIFSIVSLAFYQTLVTGIQVALDSKNRLGALALANEKMEITRNLKYEDVGTVGGVPDGILPELETVVANGISYKVKTFVQYVDDSFDGVDPADLVSEDYKRVKITVSWEKSASGTKEVDLVSRFVPPGLEVASGDGVLSVHIIDSAGNGVPQADLHIVNNSVSPAVNINQPTDGNGNLILPGAKQSIQGYAISVSKTAYERVDTVALGDVAYSPIDVHASVMTGLLNTKSIVIDLVSNLTIRSIDQSGATIPNVSFHLEGGRILGTDISVTPWSTVHITDADKATGPNGENKMENQGPGQFLVTNVEAPSGYTLVDMSSISSFDSLTPGYAFSLGSGASKTVDMRFAENSKPGLIVVVKDNAAGNPLINGATVKLTSVAGYEGSDTTSFDGVAFFTDNTGGSLIDGEYNIEVSAVGFQTYTGTVAVDKLTSQEIKLSAV